MACGSGLVLPTVESISNPTSCPSRGHEFESRRPRHSFQALGKSSALPPETKKEW
jgi:hypothetical protein